jgi:hypothetical protein
LYIENESLFISIGNTMNHKTSSINAIASFVFLVVIGLALIIAITYFRAASPGNLSSNQGHTPSMMSANYPGPDDDPTRLAIITSKAIMEATYLATTRTSSDTQAPLPTGTREGEMVKFSAEKLFLNGLNAWDGYLDGYSVVIYAGSQPEESEQGAIVVVSHQPYRLFEEKVLTPTKHGGVRVVAEQNNRLTLQTVDGEIFYFDVPARQFVDSLNEIVPTATLIPTSTSTSFAEISPVSTYNPYPLLTELPIETP